MNFENVHLIKVYVFCLKEAEAMEVKSKIKINTAETAELNKAATAALEQTAEALRTEIVQAQIMPRATGALQNESTFVDTSKSAQGRVSIVSSTPYSRRLYYHPEYNFQKTENPNARGRWFEPWSSGERKDFVPKVYAQIIGRLI